MVGGIVGYRVGAQVDGAVDGGDVVGTRVTPCGGVGCGEMGFVIAGTVGFIVSDDEATAAADSTTVRYVGVSVPVGLLGIDGEGFGD